MEQNPTLPAIPTRSSSPEDDFDPELAFNFGPEEVTAPEQAYFATYATAPEKMRLPQGVRELAMRLNHRRRAATNQNFRGGTSAWIDQDTSGTYDPKRARRTPPSIPVKRVRLEAVGDEASAKVRKLARKIGFVESFIIKLPFKSEKALNFLKTLPIGEMGTKPYESTDDSESDLDLDSASGHASKRKRVVKKPCGYTRSDGLTIDDLTDGHPQRRGCVSCFEHHDDECSLIDDHTYPCEACEDAGTDCVLIIPPTFKKVCELCKKKRRSCSYRLDGGKDIQTCDACEEEGVICCAAPLLDEGWVKRFTNTPARRKSPRSDSASFPLVSHNTSIQERMYVACNQCRSNRGSCSNKSKNSMGPCSKCRKAGQECEFVYPPKHTAADATIASKANYENASTSSLKHRWSPTSTPPPDNGDRSGNIYSPRTLAATLYGELGEKNSKHAQKLHKEGNQHFLSLSHPPALHNNRAASLSRHTDNAYDSEKKYLTPIKSPQLIGRTLGITHTFIDTAFCHPIGFNYIPGPLSQDPCSWCHNPFFGLWGLTDSDGPRKVEGYWCKDGDGFVEIFGGFSEAGYARSMMCVECTFERVRITQCGGHRMRMLDPLKGEIDMQVFDDEKWGRAIKIYSSGGDGSLVRSTKWCAVCPATATMTCCSPQLFDAQGGLRSLGDASEEGCGLCLCEDCAILLAKMVKGGARTGGRQIDALVTHVRSSSWRYPQGVRADASFITSSGELLVRLGQGLGLAVSSQISFSPSASGPRKIQKLRERKKDVSRGLGDVYGNPDQAYINGRGRSIGFSNTKEAHGIGKESVAQKVWQQLSSRQRDPAPAVGKGFMTPNHGMKLGESGIKIKKRDSGANNDSIRWKEGDAKKWGESKGRRGDHRGEILFRDVLDTAAEDVESATGERYNPIDLTDSH